MKEIRGMKIIGEKLTPKEIAARVKRITVLYPNTNRYAHWEIADIPSPITAKNTRKSNRPVGDCRHQKRAKEEMDRMVRKWGLNDPRHFFLHYREEYTPEQKRILKKYKIAVAKHIGTSRKKCPKCGAKGHVQIWPIPFGKRRLLCSQCGWTDGRMDKC